VAASLLIVAVAVRTANRAGQKPVAASVTVLPHNGPGVNGQKTAPASKAVVVTQARAEPTTAWDDTVDTRIAQVGQQMALVEQNWQARADSLDMVQYRLESVEQEVGQGKF
jgi:hypothetical protein